jgi:tetratricopeptide (TPR) repeat protein
MHSLPLIRLLTYPSRLCCAAIVMTSVFLLSTIGPCAETTPVAIADEARHLYQTALDEYLKDHDATTARERFLKCLRLDPTMPMPHYQLGMLAEKERDWATASQWFQKYLQLDDSSVLARKLAKEITNLQWALIAETTPAGQAVRESLEQTEKADILLARGDWAAASELASKAMIASPKNMKAAKIYAIAEMELGRNEVAQALLRVMTVTGTERDKSDAAKMLKECRTRIALSETYSKANQLSEQKNYGEAGDAFRAAWELRPESSMPVVRALECYVVGNCFTKAISLIDALRSSKTKLASVPASLSGQSPAISSPSRLSGTR